MQKNKQKVRLIKLWEILQRHTDEEHPVSTKELLGFLAEEGIQLERKTLYEDIGILNRCGYEVICVKRKSNYYYTEDRHFELPVLKILLDAILSASFLTPKKTDELIRSLSKYAGKHRAAVLTKNIIGYDTKRTNESILYNIDAIIGAIINDNKLLRL